MRWLLATFAMFCFLECAATEGELYPTIGKQCPDFVLNNVKYYEKKQLVLSDFKGKWFILDFWNKYCAACIASFPKTSEMQRELGEKVQVILVGIQDKEGKIETLYSKLRQRDSLIMPCAFDSGLASRWDIYSSPYIIVVDPEGKVRAITYSVSTEDMRAMMNGENVRLPKVSRMHEDEPDSLVAYDDSRPFLINGNGGADTSFLFRSVLSSFDAYTQHASIPAYITEGESSAPGRFQVLGVPLDVLYNYAFYGEPRPDSGYRKDPVLEIRDSALFRSSVKYSRNLFCYSLIVPAGQAAKQRMQQMMLHDLENYFPYTAKIEQRIFPCWKLIAISEKVRKKLHTKAGESTVNVIVPKMDFIINNMEFSTLLTILNAFHDVIDGTGITGKINMHFKGLLTDIGEVQKALHSYGLELIPAERPLKVLVIREREKTSAN